MELVDSRRLTGPNIHATEAGAVAEVRLGDAPAEPFIARWRAAVEEALDGLAARGQDWRRELAAGGHPLIVGARSFVDAEGSAGAQLMLSAPVDRLYVATEVNEWAIAAVAGEDPAFDLDALAERAAAEARERLGAMELIAAARARGLPWLLDDDCLSLGYYAGVRSLRFEDHPEGLPAPGELDWSGLAGGALAVITGTNGKTTTTRMLTRIAKGAGHRVGNTSTDGLFIDERLVDAGDWTGPGGARTLLRDPSVSLAVLEAARGGLLRRGLGVRRCDVSVITNVDRDHLGEYGVFDLEGMAAAKGVIAHATLGGGRIVLGADSEALVAWARRTALPAPVVWFSPALDNPVLVEHRARGGTSWSVRGGALTRFEGEVGEAVMPVADIPACFGGRARHNVANALAAAAAATALGMGPEAVAAGLRDFGRRPEDNPGRAHLWSVPLDPERPEAGAARLLVDFAHNDAGLSALAELVAGLSEGGAAPVICFGMAGDRSDADLLLLGAALRRYQPRVVVLREQTEYLRGRAAGEVPEQLAAGFRGAGDGETPIEFAADEPSSVDRALAHCGDGDLVVLLVHTERAALREWLSRRGAR
ncbi:mur ligase family protein [Plesiocystis pacifica SIR-1]|uniref:Mur ligase family protein n=1 Tax=Plesiocystis pacifica SIR-1 TaxID=391625 RepID=A6GJ52_9BACT|nr:Mur ligase family protein [Plesiocystis pacifica]EDM74090.1 mur ligase family protein [Plesiocystis pacifica SIR-1]